MGFKKLIGITLVTLFAVGSLIAQPLSQFNKSERNITAEELQKTRSQSHIMEEKRVEGINNDLSITAILDGRDFDSNPLTLSRSFKDALKENSDRMTMERITK